MLKSKQSKKKQVDKKERNRAAHNAATQRWREKKKDEGEYKDIQDTWNKTYWSKIKTDFYNYDRLREAVQKDKECSKKMKSYLQANLSNARRSKK